MVGKPSHRPSADMDSRIILLENEIIAIKKALSFSVELECTLSCSFVCTYEWASVKTFSPQNSPTAWIFEIKLFIWKRLSQEKNKKSIPVHEKLFKLELFRLFSSRIYHLVLHKGISLPYLLVWMFFFMFLLLLQYWPIVLINAVALNPQNNGPRKMPACVAKSPLVAETPAAVFSPKACILWMSNFAGGRPPRLLAVSAVPRKISLLVTSSHHLLN